MKLSKAPGACSALLLAVAQVSLSVRGQELLISEISDKGTSNVCDGNDWVEIYNSGSGTIDLFAEGYILHDDKGFNSPDAFSFPPDSMLEGCGYMLLCTRQTPDDPMSPQFGISGDDTVTLTILTSSNGNDASATYQVVSTVPWPNTDDEFDVTYALDPDSGSYSYTSTPTPGASNIITAILSQPEKDDLRKARMAEQNALGTQFFNMDDRGYPVADGMDTVLELHLNMTEPDYQYLLQNRSFEVYRPFQSAKVTARGDEDNVFLSLDSPGRIRPKGQFSLFYATCLDTLTSPFQLDFSRRNSSQTLFGAERVYLRNHVSDSSYARDWAYYRMAARFGLPHLRARKVRFFINGQLQGYYTLLEAVDQDYVFARSFPNYDMNNYALYKVKTASMGCGSYRETDLEEARTRVDETSTPPYAFQRGEHKPIIEVVGSGGNIKCIENFFASLGHNFADTILAYIRYNESCPNMLVEEGLIDRDLGTSSWDNRMKDLIDTALSGNIDPDFPTKVNQENSLKLMAFYAVTMNSDSPLGGGNNYYLVQSGDGSGWSIFPYDFNLASTVGCNEQVCNRGMVHWSIARPTCVSWEEHPWAGPLLSDPSLHARYLEYVREFVETVYANETFVEELQDHIQAQEKDVRNDYWSFGGIFYNSELSRDAAEWQLHIPRFPLLPTMKARTEDVRAQLDAMDTGSYPRGPHNVGVDGDYEAWETCPDWRLSEPAKIGGCVADCRYEGCYTPGWTLEGFCDLAQGLCYHGDFDQQCSGIADVEQYEGMENRGDQFAFCFAINGVPTKMSECPAPPEGLIATGSPLCPEDCMYEGCNMEGWLVPSYCDPELGLCYHGDQDDDCAGIPDLEQYPGMEDRDGRETSCFSVSGVPTKMSECPAYIAPDDESLEGVAPDDESLAAEDNTTEPESLSSGGIVSLLIGHCLIVQVIAMALLVVCW